MKNPGEKILQTVTAIEASDEELSAELNELRSTNEARAKAKALAELSPRKNQLESAGSGIYLETIVLRTGRPVLAVQDGAAVLEFSDAESRTWQGRLRAAKKILSPVIQAVGRIEVQHHPLFDWIGTGWMVDEEVIITNRHVANEFARADGKKFVFRKGNSGKTLIPSIDFLEEIDRDGELNFTIERVLHIEKEPGPDIAFLKVSARAGATLPAKVRLAQSGLQENSDIAVIGYPARDSRIPEQDLMDQIFGNVYDKKRLAPGKLKKLGDKELWHDCSTLGGNSGSVLIHLKTGEAVGIHFAGRFLETNFAVPSTLIYRKLKELSGGSLTSKSEIMSVNTGHTPSSNLIVPGQTLDFTIPIRIRVSIGDTVGSTGMAVTAAGAGDDSEDQFVSEGKPEDYDDRQGYIDSFLGEDFPVRLPSIKKEKYQKDILQFTAGGQPEQVLRYEHFSVVMSKSRRQCFFSAVNIDGATSTGMKRPAWRLDPRIPESAQIMHECYGNAPKFSRGHMTRREDPIWGDDQSASLGNSDSMHVTNTVPQMQGMNAGIWLGLENYALHNARKDQQRINVFTGPVFQPDDPVYYGVKVPRSFWKVIAFIHDETGKLCATGYELSQAEFLTENEFVFGKHKTAQKKIAEIEKKTGISFGPLTGLDAFSNEEESLESILLDFDQIRFY